MRCSFFASMLRCQRRALREVVKDAAMKCLPQPAQQAKARGAAHACQQSRTSARVPTALRGSTRQLVLCFIVPSSYSAQHGPGNLSNSTGGWTRAQPQSSAPA